MATLTDEMATVLAACEAALAEGKYPSPANVIPKISAVTRNYASFIRMRTWLVQEGWLTITRKKHQGVTRPGVKRAPDNAAAPNGSTSSRPGHPSLDAEEAAENALPTDTETTVALYEAAWANIQSCRIGATGQSRGEMTP